MSSPIIPRNDDTAEINQSFLMNNLNKGQDRFFSTHEPKLAGGSSFSIHICPLFIVDQRYWNAPDELDGPKGCLDPPRIQPASIE